MNRRVLVRLTAVVLLAWIAVDLAAVDTCALHVHPASVPGSGSGDAFQAQGHAHVPVPLHPIHCSCHGPMLTPGTLIGIAAPVLTASAVPDSASNQPYGLPSALDHPPQLLA